VSFISRSDSSMEMHKLRNQMIHVYVEDPLVLADALETAHGLVPVLTGVADRLLGDIARRGWSI
jgi:hypothetical protein